MHLLSNMVEFWGPEAYVPRNETVRYCGNSAGVASVAFLQVDAGNPTIPAFCDEAVDRRSKGHFFFFLKVSGRCYHAATRAYLDRLSRRTRECWQCDRRVRIPAPLDAWGQSNCSCCGSCRWRDLAESQRISSLLKDAERSERCVALFCMWGDVSRYSGARWSSRWFFVRGWHIRVKGKTHDSLPTKANCRSRLSRVQT